MTVMEQNPDTPAPQSYCLDEQIGFILRRATQRHLSIFAHAMPDLTPMQFAVLAKLSEAGAISQNALGRLTAMDAATIKGVVDRLVGRGLLVTRRDERDKRRTIVDLSQSGRELYTALEKTAHEITKKTLAPLDASNRQTLLSLLKQLE